MFPRFFLCYFVVYDTFTYQVSSSADLIGADNSIGQSGQDFSNDITIEELVNSVINFIFYNYFRVGQWSKLVVSCSSGTDIFKKNTIVLVMMIALYAITSGENAYDTLFH